MSMTREKAIEYLEWVRPKNPYTMDRKNVQTAIDMAIEALKEQRPQWIPVTERSPEKSGEYYVSGGDKVWVCSFLIIPPYNSGWCNNASNPVVEAWMPLPEPYKREGDEE